MGDIIHKEKEFAEKQQRNRLSRNLALFGVAFAMGGVFGWPFVFAVLSGSR